MPWYGVPGFRELPVNKRPQFVEPLPVRGVKSLVKANPMTKTTMVLILALLMSLGCVRWQASGREAPATRGIAAPQDPSTHDSLSPSQHAAGVTETCGPPYVREEATAIRIAEAVWLALYGKGIDDSRPFRAELVQNVWIVAGSLPKNSPGGVPIARIRRDNGQILQVTHTQ